MSINRNFEAFFCVEPAKLNESDEVITFSRSICCHNSSQSFKTSRVTWTYPQDVSSITSELRDIPQFCFPDLETIKLESGERSKTEHFTFTLTDKDGSRIYGICLRNLSSGEGQQYNIRRRPKYCLCIITRYPFFAMFRLVLIQVQAMKLLDQHSELYFLEAIYNHRVLSRRDNIEIAMMPSLRIYRPFKINTSDGKSSHPISPLCEILGIDKFFLLMSAALCERRIIFIANDVEALSAAVHAAAAMLYPFQWQHILIPLLPSNLLSYASAPMPYIIGVRRYLLSRLVKEALADVIIVDVDTGECTVQGGATVIDLVGDSASSRNLAREGKDRMMAGFRDVGTKLFAVASDQSSSQTQVGINLMGTGNVRDLMACIMADLKMEWASRPSGGGLGRLGRSAADTSKDK